MPLAAATQPVFRASFSVLSLWASGRRDEAVKAYFKLDRVETDAMREGKLFHAQWERETEETGCLPKTFGGAKLTKPRTEVKLEHMLEPWLQVVIVIDNLDEPVIHEYKSGRTPASDYTNSFQPKIYGLIAKLKGFKVERCMIHHHNQHTGKSDSAWCWITDKTDEEAANWLVTYASEMCSYFDEHNLWSLANQAVETDEEEMLMADVESALEEI